MDKLRAMRVFQRIVEDGSLSAAARSLDVSLPGVVRTLSALESQLGVRLLARTTRRIALTAEGSLYLERCRRILAEVDEAERELGMLAASPQGQITVTAPILFGQLHVAASLRRFVRGHGALRCSLLLHDHVVDLVAEGIDVGIRVGELPDSSLVAREFGTVRRMLVASPAYLARRGRPARPGDLGAHEGVLFGKPWEFLDGGRRTVHRPVASMAFNHGAPAIEACVDGLGLGMFLSYQVERQLGDGRLVRLLEDFELPPVPVSVVYPKSRLLPRRTRVFVDWAVQDLRRSLCAAAA